MEDVVLTKRQQQVMAMAMDGMTGQQMADDLGLSIKTIDVHRSHILSRYNKSSMTEVISCYLRERLRKWKERALAAEEVAKRPQDQLAHKEWSKIVKKF